MTTGMRTSSTSTCRTDQLFAINSRLNDNDNNGNDTHALRAKETYAPCLMDERVINSGYNLL